MKLTIECENPECEDNECLFNVEAVNIDRLFKRTEDLKDAYNQLLVADTDIQASINALSVQINEVNAELQSFIESSIYTIVTNEEELDAALLFNKIIGVKGNIEIADTSVIGINGTILFGIRVDGVQSSISLPYSAGVNSTILKIAAKDVKIFDLEITSQNPLTNTTTRDIGIALADDTETDISGFYISRCYIHHVAHGITRAEENYIDESVIVKLDAVDAVKGRIVNNIIADFSLYGIYISTNCKLLNISLNYINGRLTSLAHTNAGNGIWLGNNADYARIFCNDISGIGRHGIEYWNSQTYAETATGNKSGRIEFNTVHSPNQLGAQFAISAFGTVTVSIIGNIVVGPWNIGLELYNDNVNTGSIKCVSNYIKGCKGQSISVNNTKNCTVSENMIEDMANVSESEFGIQIVRGAQNLNIHNNALKDAGCVGIFLNGEVKAITAVDGTTDPGITIFTVSGTLETTSGYWYSGKEIYLRDFNGDVSYDALQGRHVMTLLNNDLTEWEDGDPAPSKFSVPVDSSGFAGTVPTSGILNAIYTTTSIKDNKIIHSYQHLSPFGGVADTNYAILAYEFQIIRIADNECWHKDMSSYGAIQGWNSRGEIWSGDNADGGTSVGAITSIEGSNVIIEFE